MVACSSTVMDARPVLEKSAGNDSLCQFVSPYPHHWCRIPKTIMTIVTLLENDIFRTTRDLPYLSGYYARAFYVSIHFFLIFADYMNHFIYVIHYNSIQVRKVMSPEDDYGWVFFFQNWIEIEIFWFFSEFRLHFSRRWMSHATSAWDSPRELVYSGARVYGFRSVRKYGK